MKNYKIILIVSLILVLINISFAQEKYAVAKTFTPVLNTPNFDSVFGGYTGNLIKLDSHRLINEMEFIAYPKTLFFIINKIPHNGYSIYEVITSDYVYPKKKLFIDSRFVKIISSNLENRKKNLPDKKIILERIKKLTGYPYMWGGNVPNGIEEMLQYYKPSTTIDSATKNVWILKGVDCSGLIYQATDGYTPRNTSSLINYGKPVGKIENLTAEEIIELLQPLDLIVMHGHVVIVLDKNTAIESTPKRGVIQTNLLKRLTAIMKDKKTANEWTSIAGKKFVIRRWIE